MKMVPFKWKKNKGTIKCDKSAVKYDVGTP